MESRVRHDKSPRNLSQRAIREIRSSGAAVKETSYYGPLAALLNEIGKTCEPKVKCIINLQDQGAGLPDGGFFTQEQFQKFTDTAPLSGQTPSRKKDLLGRPLTTDEAREVTNMARRLAAIVLMEPLLNANYQAVKNSCYSWRNK